MARLVIDSELKEFFSASQVLSLTLQHATGNAAKVEGIISKFHKMIANMPVTYETENQSEPLAYLHYRLGSASMFVMELDSIDKVSQAFGYSRLDDGMDFEMGYISISEWIEIGAQLVLDFEPQKVSNLISRN